MPPRFASRTFWNAVLPWAGFAVVALVFFFRVYQYRSEGRWNAVGWVANADQLTHVALLWDLTRDWHNIVGWQFSRAGFFFPDHLSYALLALTTGSFRLAILLQGLLLFAGFLAATVWMVRRLTGAGWPAVLGGTTVGLVLPMALTLLLSPEAFFHFHIFALFGANHFTAYLMALFSALLLSVAVSRPRGGAGVWLALLCLGIMLSNSIYAVYFILPALGALALAALALGRVTRPMLTAALGVLAAAGLAVALQQFLNRQGDIGLEISPAGFVTAIGILRDFTMTLPVETLVLAIIPLALEAVLLPAVLVWLARQVRCRVRDGGDTTHPLSALIVLAVLAIGLPVTELFHLAAVASSGGVVLRYAMPVFFTPLVLAALLAALLLARLPGRRAVAAAMVTTGAVSAIPAALAMPLGMEILTWRPPEARDLLACRDRLGLKAGLANYWLSKTAIAGSEWTIQLNQLDSQGGDKVHYWGSNLFWFVQDFADPSRPPTYNFIVTNRLDEAAIIRGFGAPDRIATCGDLSLFLYDDPDGLFARVVAGEPRLMAWMLAQGRPVLVPGVLLPSHTGAVEGESRVARQGRDGAGVLTYGPYITLPPGRYRVTVAYALSGPADAAASVDLARDGGRVVVPEQPLPPTGGPMGTATLDATFENGAKAVEVRVRYGGTGDLALSRITISRIP